MPEDNEKVHEMSSNVQSTDIAIINFQSKNDSLCLQMEVSMDRQELRRNSGASATAELFYVDSELVGWIPLIFCLSSYLQFSALSSCLCFP